MTQIAYKLMRVRRDGSLAQLQKIDAQIWEIVNEQDEGEVKP